MIRVEPMDMRAGTETALARVNRPRFSSGLNG